MNGEEPDEVDRILDRALLSYSKREPPPGLESRVLHYVYAAGDDSGTGLPACLGVSQRAARLRFLIPGWAFAAAIAALLLISLPVSRNRHNPTPASLAAMRKDLKTPAAGRLPADLPSPAVTRGEPESRQRIPAQSLANGAPSGHDSDRSRAQRTLRKGAVLAYVNELPKRSQFPADSPITGEERALLVLAVSAPDEALKISISQPEVAPIEVEEINIKPLRIDGLQEGAGE